ncbi:conserved hypothetical protein [Neospora caninum Liverpool]|uniref:Transmembrane protein n=1 Tax=Neospora caninum (strain Liverpool) TaxID=572307 RepID=F0VGW2_NEOCL|nr:conserved hypothetical protein [Neospora caninum Liverpool]CBZ52956.1 conserved hypothetical protein [Neospora caninum Liverpool]CEL66941.1 TPA: hypothetical protein BN1204_027450 [Neospora caninum Liverpool]|eukprot:XP_003882988.1 conserved hypothetical protein [Neospora caninum Liverpool]
MTDLPAVLVASVGGLVEFLSGTFSRFSAFRKGVLEHIRNQLLAFTEESSDKQSIVFALLGSLIMVVVLAKVVLAWFGVARKEQNAPPAHRSSVPKEEVPEASPRARSRASGPKSASSPRSRPFPVVVKKEAESETTVRGRRPVEQRTLPGASEKKSGGCARDSSQVRGRSRPPREALRKTLETSPVRSVLPNDGARAARRSESRAAKAVKNRRLSRDSEREEKITTTRSGRVSKRTPLYPGIITWEGNRPVIDLTQE